MIRSIDEVTTKKAYGPRGYYYLWCRLLENDTLEFGNEQGNYAGGTTLSYTWYGERDKSYPDDNTPGKRYWIEVARKLRYYKKHEPTFFDDICFMCKKNKSENLKFMYENGESGKSAEERAALNEAIAHARKVAKRNREQYKNCPADRKDREHQTCEQCAEEHEQLAEWLEELEKYREIGSVGECSVAMNKQREMIKYCDENDCAGCPYQRGDQKENRCMNDFISEEIL